MCHVTAFLRVRDVCVLVVIMVFVLQYGPGYVIQMVHYVGL